MPESIQLPTYSWQILNTEIIGDEPVAPRIVVDQVGVVGSGFVWSRDSSVYEFQLVVED